MSEPGAPPPPPSYTPPPPPPPMGGAPGSPGVSPNRNLMIILSYIWILFLVPMITEKDDPEVQWHAKHGAVLFVAEIILYVASWIITYMISSFSSCGCFSPSFFVWAAFLVVRILCIVKGVSGQRFIIPGISDFVNRF